MGNLAVHEALAVADGIRRGMRSYPSVQKANVRLSAFFERNHRKDAVRELDGTETIAFL
jgi:hypothetical protein